MLTKRTRNFIPDVRPVVAGQGRNDVERALVQERQRHLNNAAQRRGLFLCCDMCLSRESLPRFSRNPCIPSREFRCFSYFESYGHKPTVEPQPPYCLWRGCGGAPGRSSPPVGPLAQPSCPLFAHVRETLGGSFSVGRSINAVDRP